MAVEAAHGLSQYVIYDHPADYPDHWVVRRWLIDPNGVWATNDLWLRSSLHEARNVVPRGLVCFRRNPDDEPQIVETWT